MLMDAMIGSRKRVLRLAAWVSLLVVGAAACGDDNPPRAAVEEEPEAQPEAEPEPEEEPETPDVGNNGLPDIPIIDEEDAGGFEPACSLEDGVAPNQEPGEAAELGTDVDRSDLFICSDAPDWYRFELEAGQQMFFFVEFDARFGDLDIYLHEEGRTGRDEAVAESTSPDQSEFIDFTAPQAGVYLLQVEGFDGAENQYRLFARLGCGSDADCPEGRACTLRGGFCTALPALDCGVDRGFEPNESASTATPVELDAEAPVVFESLSICPQDNDHYLLVVPEQAGLEILIDHPITEDLDVLLFDDAGNFFGQGRERRGGEDLLARFLPPGRYILLVDQIGLEDSGATTYDLSVALQQGACAGDIDCSGVPGREFCDLDSGTCEGIISEGGQGFGEGCDDDGDCAQETAGCYEGSLGGGDNICTNLCDEDAECEALGQGAHCLQIDLGLSICVRGCESDFDCSAQFFCDAQTGRCEDRNCNVDAQCPREGESCVHGDFGQGGFCLPYDQDQVCGVGQTPDEGDNGSSGRAALVELTDGGVFFEGLGLCDDDEDWYVVELEGPSQNLTVDVDFAGNGDLDVYIYSEEGRLMGSGTEPDANPEQALSTFLAAGRYFVRVNKFPDGNGVDGEVIYTLSLNAGPIDCRIEGGTCDQTQPLRLTCEEETGACVDFQGNGEVALGDNCDTLDDCVEGAEFCFTFRGTENGGNICSHFCRSGADCADVPGSQCFAIRRNIGVCIRR